MDLVLIRHPAVEVAAGVCYGRSDVPLAGDAVDYAESLAKRLASLGAGKPQRIDTSPLTRCASVAAPLSAAHGLVPQEDARLAEMDFGAWEMRTWDAIGPAQLDAWAVDFEHAREHGGESVAQFDARVRGWFDALCSGAQQVQPAQTTWAVTHAGVMRAIAAHALGLPLKRCTRWPLAMAAVVWLRCDRMDEAWQLVHWNV